MSTKNMTVLLLVVAILLAGCTSKPQQATVQQVQVIQEQEKSIKTFGMGEIKVRPDIVRFVIVVHAEDKDLEVAEQSVDETTQKVVTVLKKFDIANEDFKEDYPNITTDAVGAKIYRYIINKDIKVALRDLTQLEPLFTQILEADVYQISSVKFQITNIDLYKEQALTLAVVDATNKAEAMAEELGQGIGSSLIVEELEVPYNYQFPYNEDINSNLLGTEYTFNQLNSLKFTEITITAKVTVKFQLK